MVKRSQLRPSLGLNISQRLVMTPSLLQKIGLLTLNRLELSELLNEELSQNPVLEEASDNQDSGTAEDKDEKDSKDDYEDFDYEYFFGEYLTPSARIQDWEPKDDRPSFEVFLAKPSNLSDHLNWQLNLSEVPEEAHEIAYFIIGNIDEDGYLTLSPEHIAETLGTSVEKVEETLGVVQSFDPIGVGSRDLRECLLLQIHASDLEGSLAEKLVQDHLELVQAKRFKELAEDLDCNLEGIAEALNVLRGLSPRPGQKYSSQKPIYIQPDVYFHKVGDSFQIVMNDDDLPRLRLSRVYRELLKRKNIGKDTRRFIRERFRSAVELLRSVDQREQTIYRVCKTIVKRQQDFLERGAVHLKPMLIKDVAEELSVHSSTISRVVANKYAHSPQGVIELRKFFTIGIESAEGENISVIHVKEKIKKIIESENSGRPFSDQKISGLLNQGGIPITRRTVAKYRDQVKIPGSRERRMKALI